MPSKKPAVERRKNEPALTLSQFRLLLDAHDEQRNRDCFGMSCEDHVADHERIALLLPYLESSKKADDAKANFWNTLYDVFGLEKMQARRAFWIGILLCTLAVAMGWQKALALITRWFG